MRTTSFHKALSTLLAALVVSSTTGVAFAQPGAGGDDAPAGDPNAPGGDLPSGDANTPGLGQPSGPVGVPVNSPAFQPAVSLNAAELEQLSDVEHEYDKFTQAAVQHDKRMREIARREYDTRTGDLNTKYQTRLTKTEQEQGVRRAETIALLEKFLATHPNHEQFTPDKMFQLADLYLDKADADTEAALTLQDASGGPQPDSPPIMSDYSKSLALWEGILTRFPNYRQTPSTLYLLAYYGKLKDERRSLQLFLALSCANKFKWDQPVLPVPTKDEALKRIQSTTVRNPYAECTPYPGADPELVRYSWVRGVADYQFTIPGEIDDTISAYLKVADGGNDSKLYAESLYKLAWSYYKRDLLPESIKRFDESVKLYDQVVASGATPALELRDESIQYIAVAFTDPWAGEADTDPVRSMERAKAFYKGRENEPHVRDVWVAMGKAFSDLQAFDQAVEAYRIALGPPWELDPKNPQVHQEIVNVYEAKGDKLAADAAAAELATRYAPGTAWYVANESNREAMENQRRLAERALYAAARNTQSAASQQRKDYIALGSKDAAAKTSYLALYSQAVDLYKQFIQIYPDSEYVYEFGFNEAESLYYSERYLEAVDQYKFVRDHKDLGEQFFIPAARGVVFAYEEEAKKEAAAGTIAALHVPSVTELRALPQPWQQQQIPGIYYALQQEYDAYQDLVPDPKAAPQQGINAALISIAYLHVDDAIARFQKVMDKFCGTPEAGTAKDGILAIYEAQSNFDAIEATNKKFIASKCGDQKTIDLAIAQNRSLNFSRAADLYAQKQYVPAAEAFYRFYKTAPAGDVDLPVALYDAAVAYKLGDRPKTAIALFKEFADNPAKPFRESSYYLDAVGNLAASYQAAFDYDNAVKTYLALYDTSKTAAKKGIKAPDPLPGQAPRTIQQIGLDALFNAALASELNRDFAKAVTLYKQYGGVETDRRKKDRALFSIVGIYRQSVSLNDYLDAVGKWRSQFGKDAGNEDDYVKSFYDEAALQKKKGATAKANAAGQATIDAWKARGSVKAGVGAQLAGEWQLAAAEAYYATTWDKYAIKKAAKNAAELTAQGTALSAEKAKAEAQFAALDQYGIVEYSMADKVRYGDIQYDYGQKLSAAPIPTPIANATDPSVQESYQGKLDANIAKQLGVAKQQWVEVVDLAKQGGISNKWSRQALEDLGREFPQEYTVLRQEIVQGTDAP